MSSSIDYDQCSDGLKYRIDQILRKIAHVTNRTPEALMDLDVLVEGRYDVYAQLYTMQIYHHGTHYLSIHIDMTTTMVVFNMKTQIPSDGQPGSVPAIITYLHDVLRTENTYYQVFEGDTPADYLGCEVNRSWRTSLFSSKKVADEYAENWSQGMCPMTIREVRV